MASVKTATFVKDVSAFFTGSAALYVLVPPIHRRDLDSDGNDLVEVVTHVVAADAMLGGMPIGTTLYQSDDTGYVTSWERLHDFSIVDSAAQALAALGYDIEGEQE